MACQSGVEVSIGQQATESLRQIFTQLWRGRGTLSQQLWSAVHDGDDVFQIMASKIVRKPVRTVATVVKCFELGGNKSG